MEVAIREVGLGSPRGCGEAVHPGTVRRPLRRSIELLAAVSTQTNLCVGCDGDGERRCRRMLLRDLWRDAGAVFGAGS